MILPPGDAHPGNAVLQLCLDRLRRRSTPATREDCARIALVVEGGGMQGIALGGMVAALEESGALPAFDLLCGTSAGAMACAFLAAGQAREAAGRLRHALERRSLLRFRRALVRQPIFDITALLDALRCPEVEAAMAAQDIFRRRLLMVATDAHRGRPVVLSGFATPQALHEAIRASVRIPVLGGPAVSIGGVELIDGSLSAPIPLHAAAAAGATHLVVLLSQPGHPTPHAGTEVLEAMVGHVLRLSYGLRVSAAWRRRRRAYLACRAELSGGVFRTPRGALPALVVAPPEGACDIGPASRNPAALLRAFAAGHAAALRSFATG